MMESLLFFLLQILRGITRINLRQCRLPLDKQPSKRYTILIKKGWASTHSTKMTKVSISLTIPQKEWLLVVFAKPAAMLLSDAKNVTVEATSVSF